MENKYQIYLKSEALANDIPIATLINDHPEIKELVKNYPIINLMKRKTLKDICPRLISISDLQEQIDKATGFRRD